MTRWILLLLVVIVTYVVVTIDMDWGRRTGEVPPPMLKDQNTRR